MNCILKECEIYQLIYGCPDAVVESCIEHLGQDNHRYASQFARFVIGDNKDDVCSLLYTDCSF